ncbi:cytochrome P450 [Sphaerisporangium corydalis]|uniref:Cytochrome P450 n=1 Tax=Sphaerisporangium corydalis TaxID=1441875 RepID=A0ABV9ENA3_9ACTN|nr:cytochrome P450 [Sphaerisporangium corydalis]
MTTHADCVAPGPDLVVTGHAEVRAVLADPRFTVPPPPPGGTEVPGTVAWLRGRVSRFSAGRSHERRRALVRADLDLTDPRALRVAARSEAAAVLERAGRGPVDVMSLLARAVPLRVLGGALGVADGHLDALVAAVSAVAAAYHPGADAHRTARADAAVDELLTLLGGDRSGNLEDDRSGDMEGGRSGDLEGGRSGDLEVVANRIGTLVQACDATAGLIGNTLDAALRLPPGLSLRWSADALVAETLRLDPPVRSTRRLATEGAELAGRPLAPGTLVVLDLAAANRDPRVFTAPHRFEPGRAESLQASPHVTFDHGRAASPHLTYDPGRTASPHLNLDPGRAASAQAPSHLTFGSGLRPCPGAGQGTALACGVVEALLPGYELAADEVPHEPSPNLRVPLTLMVRPR